MPIIFPFEEDDDCTTRILLFVFVLIVVADKLKEKKAVRTYEQRTTIRYQVSEISAFYPDCW